MTPEREHRQIVMAGRGAACVICGRRIAAGTEAVRSRIGDLLAHVACADLWAPTRGA